jgi:hypothetical protein
MGIKTMKTNKVKATTAAIKEELNIESVTLDASVLIHEYDLACYAMDDANLAQYNATKGMHGITEKMVKAGFKTLQSGHNKKRKPKDGEFPYTIAASEFEANYLARHKSLHDAEQNGLDASKRTDYVAPSKTAVDNIVKQKIASLSFLLDYGKYTSNVGKDKPRLIAEVLNEKWLSLLQDKKAAEASAIRAAGIAAESLKGAQRIQAAVVLAQANSATPPAVTTAVVNKAAEATNKADIDAIAAEAAKNELAEIAAEVAEVEAKKNQAAAVAEVKKSKKTVTPSASTTTTGKPDHSASTDKISVQAGISPELALEVDKAFSIMTGKFTTRQLMYLRELLNKELINCTE